MMLDYSEPRKVKVNMEDYVNKIIEKFPEEVTKVAKTLAMDFLFKVN